MVHMKANWGENKVTGFYDFKHRLRVSLENLSGLRYNPRARRYIQSLRGSAGIAAGSRPRTEPGAGGKGNQGLSAMWWETEAENLSGFYRNENLTGFWSQYRRRTGGRL